MASASRFSFSSCHTLQTNLSKTNTTAANSNLAHLRRWNRSQENISGKQLCWEPLCLLDICLKMKRCFNWPVIGGKIYGHFHRYIKPTCIRTQPQEITKKNTKRKAEQKRATKDIWPQTNLSFFLLMKQHD